MAKVKKDKDAQRISRVWECSDQVIVFTPSSAASTFFRVDLETDHVVVNSSNCDGPARLTAVEIDELIDWLKRAKVQMRVKKRKTESREEH